MITSFSIDNTQRYQVIAHIVCRRILVKENFTTSGGSTTDLLQSQPAGGAQVNVLAGTVAIYTPEHPNSVFVPNQVVGEIETVSGSIVVQQVESQTI